MSTLLEMRRRSKSASEGHILQATSSVAACVASKEQSQSEVADARRKVVMPILESWGWTRCKWAIKAGVGKNCVYEYLEGKRNLSIDNRKALAEELNLSPEALPE